MASFPFYADEKEHWQVKKLALFEFLKLAFSVEGDFQVEVKNINKSAKQIRGFYRVCDVLAPYMSQAEGILCDRDFVKEFVKLECSFYTSLKGKNIPKSLVSASKEEMNMMIGRLMEIGAAYDAVGYELTNYEKQALLDYYNKQ